MTFHNADSGFCVLRIKARRQRDLVTVVGHAASIAAGEWVQMSGAWINDRTHWLQFKAAFLKASPLTTLEGIETYLGFGMIRGIGPVYATTLVRAFGAAVFELIANKAIPWVETRTGLTFAESQRTAAQVALCPKVLVITGGPAVSKTTLVNSILKIICAKGVEVALCAPTGRAAKRLTESTRLGGWTIHRLLESDPKTGGFKRGEEHPLDCGLLVVDETGMVDVLLMWALLKALLDQAALLPSVGLD